MTRTFWARSFMLGVAARVVAARRTDGADDMKPAAGESCLIESKAKRLVRMVKGVCNGEITQRINVRDDADAMRYLPRQ